MGELRRDTVATKIVSINIERHKHFDRVVEFLKKENPEIICLMEVCESDVKVLAGDHYSYTVFAPNDAIARFDEGEGFTGVAILSKQPIDRYEKFYCSEDPNLLMTPIDSWHTHLPVVVMAKIGELQIGAVHFSWTANGAVDERQKKHTRILLDYLSTKGELVLCGDFNIPRGNEIYEKIEKTYKDNIPVEIDTTLDPKLHRANFTVPGKLKFVVDYVWTTPKYQVSELRVEQGISDHCGLVFNITQN